MSGENVEKTGNMRTRQARAAAPLALLFAAIVIASFAIFSSRIKSNEARLCEGVAHNASEELAAFVGEATASGLPLAAAIEENPAIWKSGIEALAKDILDARSYVVGVSVAPSAIVKYHFPEDGNESLLGHDLLSNPERRDALTAAVERKAPVLSGPDESVDGKRMLFIRYPVFVGGKLWGFTSLTIDFVAMIENLALEKHFPGFSFALSDKDYIGGARGAFADGRVAEAVKLPGVEWTLHVLPAAGWSSRDPFLSVLLAAGITGALLLFVTLWRKPAPSVFGAARASASARAKEISAFDLAVREAGELSASRERPWREGVGNAPTDRPNVGAPPEPERSEDSAATSAPTATEASAAMEPPETGIYRPSTSPDDVQILSSDGERPPAPGVDSVEARKPREVKFIGPDVRGELYMPERIISGEPGSLFARFAAPEKAETKTPENKTAKAETLEVKTPKVETPKAETPERIPIPERASNFAPRSQKAFAFTVEEPAPAKADGVAKADSAVKTAGEAKAASDAKSASDAKALAILVVDDSEANREIMGRMLALRGFQADFAVSGEESLERCSRRAYDIVFMDCFMPGMDGYKASAALRERFAGRVRTIVGMSARIGDQEIERCRQAGMDDLLAKPFTLKQLLAHLERL